ncbi:hypothetical protein [Rhizomonospora bruguierae]|uniref:hypothetical protein n=1 Tax=Rhizomonospora bruguierae TaxID=1581705 RepID=UPI001BCFB5BF|nr:hypothetical protein [Micromonospora sp. NBRC 107566]
MTDAAGPDAPDGGDLLERQLRPPVRAIILCVTAMALLVGIGAGVRVPWQVRLVPVDVVGVEVLAVAPARQDPQELVGAAVTAHTRTGPVPGRVVAVRPWAPRPGDPPQGVVVVALPTPPAEIADLTVVLGRRSLFTDIVAEA